MSNLFSKIAIVGVGLIGGSIGMAINKANIAGKVIGIDIYENNIKMAKELKAIDEGFTDITRELESVDLVILAAPVSVNLSILKDLKAQLKPGTVITDVGSTKGEFVKSCEEILGSDYIFIGGHPMAGSEVGGIKGADAYLFENAIYLLTPTVKTNLEALEKLKLLVKAIGGKVLIMDPEEHDLLVAAISHLPHLIATNLVNTVKVIQKDHPNTMLMAAGGFKDTTRIASGNPDLWRDICFNNKDKLLHLIKLFKNNLNDLESYLRKGREEEFRTSFAEAKAVRDEIPKKLKGYWPFLEEVMVTIQDKPGMIAQVATILGNKGINIDDIEILRVREGEGGSLRLGFASHGSAQRAVIVLNEEGIVAREK